jgi:hypothetical protein
MIGHLLAAWFRHDIDRLTFPDQTVAGRALFKEIFGAVRTGGVLGLHACSESELLLHARHLPWHLRPFLHEGHAIGHAGRVACALRRRNPEAAFAQAANRPIRFLSYGYWVAIAERYPLPSWPIDGARWRDEPQHPRYRRLMLNGLGFARVLLRGRFDADTARQVLRAVAPEDRPAVLHGVGRVLWFLHLGNPAALTRCLERHAALAEALAVGIGVAVCFTQVTNLAQVEATLLALPAHLRPWLRSGAGIALRFHAVNDAEAEVALEANLHASLRPWYLAARAASLAPRGPRDSVDWYYDRLPVSES